MPALFSGEDMLPEGESGRTRPTEPWEDFR
jgi:hypothetical protein